MPFSLTDIAILSNHRGSISQKLLWDLGSSGMVIHELVFILDRLRLENILIDIKEYGRFSILSFIHMLFLIIVKVMMLYDDIFMY